MLITNNSKPTLTQIKNNMFEANSRYLSQMESKRKVKERFSDDQLGINLSTSATFATNVPDSLKYKACKLCKATGSSLPDHSMSRCNNFPSSSEKIKRILELNGCIRCSSLAHQKDKCTTKFDYRCKLCSGWHLQLLCNEGQGKTKNGKSNENEV